MINKLEWIFMIMGIVAAIVSIIIAIATNENFTWQIITILWIGTCILKQRTIENLTKK
jgi:hypothetical protein